jgi:hypothetical protein
MNNDDPDDGPYAPLRVYEAVLHHQGIKQPRTRAPAGNPWTKRVVAFVMDEG